MKVLMLAAVLFLALNAQATGRSDSLANTETAKYMKGVNLYSWKEASGKFWFALLPGTNRMKRTDEVYKAKVTPAELIGRLRHLPKNTTVSWNNESSVDGPAPLAFSMPPMAESRRIGAEIKNLGLTLR